MKNPSKNGAGGPERVPFIVPIRQLDRFRKAVQEGRPIFHPMFPGHVCMVTGVALMLELKRHVILAIDVYIRKNPQANDPKVA